MRKQISTTSVGKKRRIVVKKTNIVMAKPKTAVHKTESCGDNNLQSFQKWQRFSNLLYSVHHPDSSLKTKKKKATQFIGRNLNTQAAAHKNHSSQQNLGGVVKNSHSSSARKSLDSSRIPADHLTRDEYQTTLAKHVSQVFRERELQMSNSKSDNTFSPNGKKTKRPIRSNCQGGVSLQKLHKPLFSQLRIQEAENPSSEQSSSFVDEE